MVPEQAKIEDLPYNTLTVYFAPLLFNDTPMDFFSTEIRLLTDGELFEQGYLKKNISIQDVLSKFYMLTNLGNFYNNQYILHSFLGDIFWSEGELIVYKLNTFRFNLPPSVLTDLQSVLYLRSSALSRRTKRKIQLFWQEHNRTKILYKITDELYPTDHVKFKLSVKLGVDFSILKEMTDITEAIKYDTDSLQGVLAKLDIQFTKEFRQ
jgi:hypothetical protein